MILDSSVVVAVLFREEGYQRFEMRMDEANSLAIGAPTLVETNIVAIGRFDMHGRALVEQFVEGRDVVVTPFDRRHLLVAAEAFARFGKGRHPAKLNYGDCMTYATARLADLPLLCTGDDFPQTDLAIA